MPNKIMTQNGCGFFDISISYKELREKIIESKYSRLPIFEETLDNVKGVIYVKDLLPYI